MTSERDSSESITSAISSEAGAIDAQDSWSLWKKFSDSKFGDVETREGVYKFRSVKDGKPTVVHRVGGDDPDGILYLGETRNLRARLKTQRAAMRRCNPIDLVRIEEITKQ